MRLDARLLSAVVIGMSIYLKPITCCRKLVEIKMGNKIIYILYPPVMESIHLSLKKIGPYGIAWSNTSGGPRDSDLSHFGNDPKNVSSKVWVISPKMIKFACDSLKT